MGNVYLERFKLPDEDTEEALIKLKMAENGGELGYISNTYPARFFTQKGLSELNFDCVTILYGGNGSGKSTLLNLIAARLQLDRLAPYNGAELFQMYAQSCGYQPGTGDDGSELEIPEGSRIITSDDVFDYMLAVRANNQEIAETTEKAKANYMEIKFGDTVKFSGMEDYEAHRAQILTRRKTVSRRKFLRQTVGEEAKLHSNGETALEYFDSHLKADTLYCLDEPENSLSPKLQLELKDILEDIARCGSQLIIATHSPFILAMRGARIYDLDEVPVDIKPWWELENAKIYYKFFKENAELFE